MPGEPKIEIKGLGMAAQAIRRSIALLRKELSDLHHDSWDLQKTVTELREQIAQTHADLKFEAQNLTNDPAPGNLDGNGIDPLPDDLSDNHTALERG